MSKRKVIIGIDGAPFSLMEELADQGVIPFLRSLARDGVFRPMRSSVPAVSSVSWSSIVTGRNPGEHGIYGFSDMVPGTYSIRYPNFLDLKRPPFWHHETGNCVIINVPSTYPAQPLQGCHISGFVSPRLEKAVYPSSELETLETLGYRVDLDVEKAKQSELVLYKQLYETHAKREELADYLWEEYHPAVFMLVVTGSDRIGHFGWHHWQDQDHPSHDKFLEYFRRVDQTIERIAERLNPEDRLLVLSDHGMEGSVHEVNLNACLMDGGFLKLDQGEARKYNRIQEGSAAFALENGRVYVNERERFPKGSVEASQQEALLDRLTEFLAQLQVNGGKAIRQVHRREEIYYGDNLHKAPHLVAVPNPSFRLVGRLTADLHQPSRLPGMHNDQAFLMVRDPRADEIVPETPTVEDVVSIIRD
ncbi:MAG: alkaline phosphatase family protein [Armatimonadota bacterium]|nr:alkaline phosphatase family protein [Armatimonadota bacterium]